MPRRIVERMQLMPPFSESDQQRKQHRADQEPGRNRDVDGDGASDRAQNKPGGDGENVDDDDLLQPKVIGSHETGVCQKHQEEPPAREAPIPTMARTTRTAPNECRGARRELSGRERGAGA